MSDLILLSEFGRRRFGEGGRIIFDKITEDIFSYEGSVIFPDGRYILDHQKVDRCEEDRDYYLQKYIILSKAVSGEEEALKNIFGMMFRRYTDYGPEDVRPDDPYGYNPFAILREAEEKVRKRKKGGLQLWKQVIPL